MADKKDILEQAGNAVAKFDKSKGLETKVKGHVDEFIDKEASVLSPRLATFNTAYETALWQYMIANRDNKGILKKSAKEAATEITKMGMKAYIAARGTDTKLDVNNDMDNIVLQDAIERMTGISQTGLEEALERNDKINSSDLAKNLTENVGKASANYFVSNSAKKFVGLGMEQQKTALQSIADILGHKLIDKDTATAEDRSKLYTGLVNQALDRYGTEYL